MKGFSAKRVALKVDVIGPEIYCLQARPCNIQPENFAGSERVKIQIHKRFKITFIGTKYDMRIFGVIPYKTTLKRQLNDEKRWTMRRRANIIHLSYPENSHVAFCPNKQRYFELFCVFGSCFRTLAVILVLNLLVFSLVCLVRQTCWLKGSASFIYSYKEDFSTLIWFCLAVE